MLKIVARGCAPLAAMFALAGPTPAAAQVVELSGPEAFSGAEVQLDFEDPNLFDGMPLPDFDGVAIDLEDASSPSYGGARFGLAFEPREFGPADPGSINNFGVGDLPFPFPAMRLSECGQLLRIFIGESDKHDGQALYEWIVRKAREHGLAGATVLRGLEGYGARSVLHTAKILRLSSDLPVVIEIVDAGDKIEAFLPIIDGAIRDGLATLERVEVRFYRSGIKSS